MQNIEAKVSCICLIDYDFDKNDVSVVIVNKNDKSDCIHYYHIVYLFHYHHYYPITFFHTRHNEQ